MKLFARSLVVSASLLAHGCSSGGSKTTSSAAPPSSDPAPRRSESTSEALPARPAPLRLVVLLVVDQLPSWSFEHDKPLTQGGIARLLDEGVHYTQGEYPYAITFTAPGHASLGTGAPPARTGIIANHWFDRTVGRSLGAAEDDRHPTFAWVALDGDTTPTFHPGSEGASSRALLVEGIADVLERETEGASKTIAIGLKERAAGLMLGQRPDLAVWFDANHPAMTTSTAFADEPPPWLASFNAGVDWPAILQSTWDVQNPEALAQHTGRPDDAPGEGDGYGLGSTFPKHLAQTPNPAKAFRLTPWADEVTVDAALAAIRAEDLGGDATPDLLGITFSAHDYAGHAWGQESWERLDLFLRLDEQIARLLDELDTRVGPSNYAVVLTSDHGATPLVEKSRAEGLSARRIPDRDVQEAARAALGAILGPGDWLEAIDASSLYLSNAFHQLPAGKRNEAIASTLDALRGIDGLAHVDRTDALDGDCDTRRGLGALLCWSLHPERSGDIVYVARDQCLSGSYTAGTGHGSAADHDRRVPIVVRVPTSRGRRVDAPTSTLRVAPTLAALLGIPAPEAALQEPLELEN